MIIGIPRSRVADEHRVALPPRAAAELTARGHEVHVEVRAGLGAGFTDEQYEQAGARIAHSAEEIWGRADMVVKVGKPQPDEYPFVREGQILASVMNLAAAERGLIDLLVERRCLALDFVTIQEENGNLPVLRPLSQIAGRMVPQIAARYLQTDHGGLGILLGGAPAVPPAEVVVIGAGTVGRNAVRACIGAGARVTLLDSDFGRITELDWTFPGQVTTFLASEATLRKALSYADVVVGAVLIPGARTPHLVTREMVGLLREKSLVIDISVDQGGCFATSRPTRLSDPTYVVDGVTHFCVPNLPSLVARSSSYALGGAILPYLAAIAARGPHAALAADPSLARGVNVMDGLVTQPGLAAAHGCAWTPVADLLPGGTS
ncbi:MAG: alanine dehydrogenase [bacterium]|nr:alanine dehydrogenase [bacterium]